MKCLLLVIKSNITTGFPEVELCQSPLDNFYRDYPISAVYRNLKYSLAFQFCCGHSAQRYQALGVFSDAILDLASNPGI